MTATRFQISIKLGAWCSPTLLCLHSFKRVISTTKPSDSGRMTNRHEVGLRAFWCRCLPLKKIVPLLPQYHCFLNWTGNWPRGKCFRFFLALTAILHNELISTKRVIFAPRGPGVNVVHRNKRALIEIFQRVSIRYVRSISTASVPE